MSAIFGERLVLPQERGDRVELVVFGDEFYARYETPAGHTVVYDADVGRFCYARLAAGRLVSSGTPVEKPPPPGLRTHLKEDPAVRNESFGRRYADLRPRERMTDLGVTRTFGVNNGLLEGRRLSEGQVRGLTVLVDFPDVQSAVTAADVDALLNQPGYSANGNRGSVRDYFLTVSGGRLDYTNTVVGPVRLSKPQSFYINTNLVREALDLAIAQHGVRLADFDSRGERIVDAVNFMYAGRTVYQGDLWPHNATRSLTFAGGMRTHFYMLTSLGRQRVDLSIGTFCHESGHLLCRFPDLYDYGERDGDFEESAGIGAYCLMGSGNHLGGGRAPAAVCGYLRHLVDWPDDTVLLNEPGDHDVRQGDYARLFKYETSKLTEYFIVENRTRAGIDTQLPASGLAVYHCDTLGSNEWAQGTREKHYQVALLQADGHLDLESNRNQGDAGDLFGAVPGVAVGDTTVPSSREWDGTGSGLTILEVGAPAPVVHIRVGEPRNGQTDAAEVRADLLIPDAQPAGIASALRLSAAGKATALAASVDIVHPYIGDLRVVLVSPAGTEAVLHDRAGAAGDDVRKTYRSDDPSSPLAALVGEDVAGEWTLRVSDVARRDTGRLNWWRIEVACEPVGPMLEGSSAPQRAIPDNDARGIEDVISIAGDGSVRRAEVDVAIRHSFIGDLVVELTSPSAASAVLHDRVGGGRDDLRVTYDETNAPALANLRGQGAGGDWTLRVRDVARQDVGMLERWAVRLVTD
jgi:M6 family metalloprotease-like protein